MPLPPDPFMPPQPPDPPASLQPPDLPMPFKPPDLSMPFKPPDLNVVQINSSAPMSSSLAPSNVCPGCSKPFASARGVAQHRRSCVRNTNVDSVRNRIEIPLPELQPVHFNTASIQNSPPSNLSYIDALSNAYDQVVHWRKNLFELPKGKLGKDFINEMTANLEKWSNAVSRPYCIKALMLLPNLLLQKSTNTLNAKHKNKINRENFERRFALWKDNKILNLLIEGQTIQNRLPTAKLKDAKVENISRKFRSLISSGNINGALRLLDKNRSGVLPLDNDTRKLLDEKHPKAEPLFNELLLDDANVQEVHPVIFYQIDSELIKKVALKTKGAAGPSNLDADAWRRILVSKYFVKESSDLAKAIAEFAKSLCQTNLDDLKPLESYLACSLIPLDKNPGLRPIGIGEVLRRIIGKAVTTVLMPDLKESVDGVQMCVSSEGGAEAAVHAMCDIFSEGSCQGAIQVDANNAFNSINRKVLLHNVKVLCPPIATFTHNCYSVPSRLFVTGGVEIESQEGTTQGDPIAMPIYAIGIDPLLRSLREINNIKQVGFADDLSGAGSLLDLKAWWKKIALLGPKIGYYTKTSKSWLIVKPEFEAEAREIFADSGLNITTEGRRHLGAVLGSEGFRESYVNKCVHEWVDELNILSDIAKTEPHSAYSAYTISFKSKYNYVMRTIPNISNLLAPLDNAIDKFISVLLQGREFNNVQRSLFALPVKLGGLGLPIPSKMSDDQYSNSRLITRQLVAQIKSQSRSNMVDPELLRKDKLKVCTDKARDQKASFESLSDSLSESEKHLVSLCSEKGASLWLTAVPLSDKGFLLTKQEFCDAICIRYGFPLKHLPSSCVCGSSFSIEHALSCSRGGYVIMRHNNIRDIFGSLVSEICNDVTIEPQLTHLSGETFALQSTTTDDDARLDVSARGFWSRGARAFFDVRVFNPMARSYRSTPIETLYKRFEKEKKRKYNERVLQVEHGSFTPLVFSTLGGYGREADRAIKQLAERIALNQNANYNKTVTMIRMEIAFSIIKATALCIRGSRSKYPKQLSNTIDVALDVANARIM